MRERSKDAATAVHGSKNNGQNTTQHACTKRDELFHWNGEFLKDRDLIFSPAVATKNTVYWDVTSCGLVDLYQRFGGTSILNLQE